MSLFQRLQASLRGQGPGATIMKFRALLTDRLYDLKRGTDTGAGSEADRLTIAGENRERSRGYQPTRVLPLRRLFRELEPALPPGRVLVDFGCGKGRVLLVASECGFAEARGVEFARELCEIARRNCARVAAASRGKCRFEIIEGDAAQYAVRPDETVFFMFNPFDGIVLQRVVENIAASLWSAPRKILIIYYNPKCGEVIDRQGGFARVREYDFWGYRFTVYANRD